MMKGVTKRAMLLLVLSLSTGEGGAGRCSKGQAGSIESLDPDDIRFSHSKIYEKFSCGRYRWAHECSRCCPCRCVALSVT